MKQANNNEVDLLLRSLARQRDNSGSRNGSGFEDSREGLSEHLDADELNSYAEGVVPAPARLRYQEHLADCESCRRIVIDLSQAAGVATRYEVPAAARRIQFLGKDGGALFTRGFAVCRSGVGADRSYRYRPLCTASTDDRMNWSHRRPTQMPRAAAIEPQSREPRQSNPSASATPSSVSSNNAYDSRSTTPDKNLQGDKSSAPAATGRLDGCKDQP